MPWFSLLRRDALLKWLLRLFSLAEAMGSFYFLNISVAAASALDELPAGTSCTIKYFPGMS